MQRTMDTTDFAQRIRLNLAQSHAQLQRSVCPLYGADIRGLPRLIGSGVLIKVASRSIMATAGHVLDENEHSNFYVAGRHELVELEGSMHSSVAPQAGREGDNIDLGFIILSDRLATELGQRFTFLSAEAIDAQDLPLAHQLYAFIGYPVTLNKA